MFICINLYIHETSNFFKYYSSKSLINLLVRTPFSFLSWQQIHPLLLIPYQKYLLI